MEKQWVSWLHVLWRQATAVADELHLWKMDYLTELGRKHLPEGYWGERDNGQTYPGQVYLTFDDGPCPHTTPWLLEMLSEQKVKATFFLIGSQVVRHEHLVEKIASLGHLIGNHSFHHPLMPVLTTRQLEKEIDVTNLSIEDITKVRPDMFRPPFGVMDKRVADCLAERQMTTVYWGAVPEDWLSPGAKRVTERVIRRLVQGTLIVLHERRALTRQTLTAAKEIICKGRELGYEFALVPGKS
ncbi:MAG: polysaccharide deacetylase family protein [Candidatus Melainabacteria bacterium]|nr:polysaccharide deacetylase family protein [Candidatus Melainabacteria bacterium]